MSDSGKCSGWISERESKTRNEELTAVSDISSFVHRGHQHGNSFLVLVHLEVVGIQGNRTQTLLEEAKHSAVQRL